jgi:hypothetical protein
MGRHPLAGDLSVEASAKLIRHYRYAEERLMRIMGGWIALTPELPGKLLLGRHVWDCAQHADLWGRRLPELRSTGQQSEPANERVVSFFDLLEGKEAYGETPERLAGVYRVLKPHLAALYARHLEVANAVYEPPTRRILARCLDEERRHIAAGAAVLAAVVQDPPRQERAARWATVLADALDAAGGATGEGPVVLAPLAPHPLASQDVVMSASALDPRALPAELSAAVDRHRRAVQEDDMAAAGEQIAAVPRALIGAEYGRLPRPLTGSEVVGLAKVGHHRMIKIAFTGPQGTSVVQQQWRWSDGRWLVAAAELVRVEPKR